MTRTPERRYIIDENGVFSPDFANDDTPWWKSIPVALLEGVAIAAHEERARAYAGISQSGLGAPHRFASEIAARLAALRFDNGNNSAISLHCIAEWARSGKLKISLEDRADGVIRLAIGAA